MYSYMQWGEDCVKCFNGMFAFAIWDKTEQVLYLARDRYGIKPVYYSFNSNTFCFASEQKSILTHPSLNREIDLGAVYEYFTFQNIFTDKTFFKNIKLFPAGCWAKLYLGDMTHQLSPVKYWDFNFQENDQKIDEVEYLQELDRLFRQAVNRQLFSDVELGCYLSGGMDSGSITAIAALNLPYIKTFTCGFDLQSASGLELGFDERDTSEYMSYLFKTEHYEMVLKAGDMERIMNKMAWHLEEPRVGQSYPNYYAAQLAGKFVKVVLSGTGGDELFGGYPWRYYRAVVNNSFEDYINKYYSYWQRLMPKNTLQRLFKRFRQDIANIDTKDIFQKVFSVKPDYMSKPEDYINHSLYLESKTFLHGLLIVEDKLSMAHSLETRLPFLDNDLVDFSMKVPVNLKLGNLTEVVSLNENEPGSKTQKFFNKNKDGKLILRKAMKRYIPEKVTQAVKQGFSAPDASWFRGESIDYVKRKLFNRNALIYEYMDRETVEELVSEHIDGKMNRRLLIWSFLNFECWMNQYLI
jgi:asparagine synthase (glutamine-hydrolysing)